MKIEGYCIYCRKAMIENGNEATQVVHCCDGACHKCYDNHLLGKL
jgi:hypothetical protein